jgi:hypothetical protein
LTPAGGAETDGEDGENPGMGFGKETQDEEEYGPNAYEKDCDEENDLPGWNGSAPKVRPIPSVGRAQPEILQDNGDEEPLTIKYTDWGGLPQRVFFAGENCRTRGYDLGFGGSIQEDRGREILRHRRVLPR